MPSSRDMAGDEIGVLDQVMGQNPIRGKAEMRNGHPARFFRIIGKIGLREHVCVLADDFDRFLVCADSPVGADAPEFALSGSLGRR
jgi:hypothetical protein